MNRPELESADYGLIVQEDGPQQNSVARVLTLMLNYQYGLSTLNASGPEDAAVEAEGGRVRAVFAVDTRPPTAAGAAGLSADGSRPLFWLCPAQRLDECRRALPETPQTFLFTWNELFDRLQSTVASTFATCGIERLWDAGKDKAVDRQRVQRLLQNLDTLPTLPQVILRIMRLLNDPHSSAAELENALLRDPAVVHKLLRVIASPVFAGHGHSGAWTLKEAIVRLGRRKVGAVVQQIKLINSFVKPQESGFDLKRFWLHSVGCAVVADRLYTGGRLPIKGAVHFDDYWIAALLHDIGKLFLGSFFWPYFAAVSRHLQEDDGATDFAQAEARFGHVADHEHIGRLLLLKSKMPAPLIEAVGTHHSGGAKPRPLVCLIHLADNLSKDLGLGYLPEARGVYSPAVLRALRLKPQDLEALRQGLGTDLKKEIDDLVGRCL